MTTYNYDAIGNQVSKVDANGFTTIFSYDALSRPDNVDNPGSDPDFGYTYNDTGLYDTMTDGLGSTQWDYDGLGRIISLVDPNNNTISYEYDAGGNRKSLTYPDLKQVSYSYDLVGRLNSVTSWDSSITSYQYDRKGQLDLVTLPNSLSTDYTFNDAGYLTQKVNSVNSTTLSSFGYSYDNVGNRVSASETTVLAVPTPVSDVLFVDSFESTEMSKWNRNKSDLGDLSVTTQAAMTGTYGLKAEIDDNTSIYVMDWSPRNETRYKASFKFDMNTISMTLDDAHYLLYAYDTSGGGMLRVEFQKARKGYQVRAESLKDSGWNSTSWYTISDAPHTIQVEWKSATSSSIHDGTLQLWIDGVSKQLVTKIDNDTVRLDNVKLGVVEGVDVGTRGTEYFDDFNSWRSQAWTVGETVTRTITYDYDPLYRLTSASSSDGDLFQYTYDAVGNRLSETTMGNVTLNYVYDNANRLSSVEGVSYTWDDNGNLLSDVVSTYTYNHSNQLTGVSQGGTNYSYAYNGLGDRLRQTAGGNTVNYVIDSSSGLSQVLADGTNTYLYGLDRISQSNPGGKDYFLGDALGSVRQMANTSGGIVLSRNYEPYGTIYGALGNSNTAYGFTSEWTDGTGLVNLRARYYAPTQGRFMSRDRWGGVYFQPISYNKWIYANANPIAYLDPSGYIAEFEAEEANKIIQYLTIVDVYVNVDWGKKLDYWFNDPADTGKFDCGWNPGRWSLNELKIVKGAAQNLSSALNHQMSNFIGRVSITKTPYACGRGCTTPGHIKLIDNNLLPSNSPNNGNLSDYKVMVPMTKINFDQWTVVHELGHAWDFNKNGSLHTKLVWHTGGSWGTNSNCDADHRLPGCNTAGYFYGGIPAKGSDNYFNPQEDFAESVAAYVFPTYAQDQVQKYYGTEKEKYLWYLDFTKTKRWAFIDNLVSGNP